MTTAALPRTALRIRLAAVPDGSTGASPPWTPRSPGSPGAGTSSPGWRARAPGGRPRIRARGALRRSNGRRGRRSSGRYTSNDERTAALADFLHTYNHHRCHTALGGHPPISRINNAAGQYT